MGTYEEIREEFRTLPQKYHPDQAGDLDAIIEGVLTGEGGGRFVFSIYKKNLLIEEGRANNPNMRFTMAAETFLKIRSGELDAMDLALSGDIQLEGDRSLAVKMRSIVEGGVS